MYAFLLSLGAAITAAGIALVASGVSLEDRALDASGAMPGIIAIIGGCILIGLSFVVRALLRVERALGARAAARAAQADGASAATPTDATGEPRIPLPPKPPAPEADTEPAAAEQASAQASSEKSSAAERIENAPVVDAGDVSLLPKEPVRADDEHGAAPGGLSNGKLNGASHTTTAPPRLAGGPGRRPQPKNSIFDTLWPKASSAAAEASPGSTAQPAAAAAASAQPAQAPAERIPAAAAVPAAAAAPSQTPASVSILKSGVVEGMAYTLYSDGSIEAQLPGGTVRFGSITELRSHIEQNG